MLRGVLNALEILFCGCILELEARCFIGCLPLSVEEGLLPVPAQLLVLGLGRRLEEACWRSPGIEGICGSLFSIPPMIPLRIATLSTFMVPMERLLVGLDISKNNYNAKKLLKLFVIDYIRLVLLLI